MGLDDYAQEHPQEPAPEPPTVEQLLGSILAGQQQISERLDVLEKKVDNPAERKPMDPGTLELPEGVPAPEWPHYPWDQLDDEARQAWINAHQGGPGERALKGEWIEVELPGGTGAAFPPPPVELKAEWATDAVTYFENWAIDSSKGWLLPKDTMIENFGKAGPLWFAAYAHEYLMELPQGMRKRMVEQVLKYAPDAGTELARDILREDTESANSWKYGDALVVADMRKAGVVRGRDSG